MGHQSRRLLVGGVAVAVANHVERELFLRIYGRSTFCQIGCSLLFGALNLRAGFALRLRSELNRQVALIAVGRVALSSRSKVARRIVCASPARLLFGR